ncbi:hypothetical protein [Paenibacillus sp. FSL H7-0331]|uniref:hypothetical protein n=1 Tax=Paenibacillus sp. FSL H7-0331 TaxID=1920421 RepID=UPI00117F554C|nr:hypothetical protein [Paenibacillus sp. FSL H7-0331]
MSNKRLIWESSAVIPKKINTTRERENESNLCNSSGLKGGASTVRTAGNLLASLGEHERHRQQDDRIPRRIAHGQKKIQTSAALSRSAADAAAMERSGCGGRADVS